MKKKTSSLIKVLTIYLEVIKKGITTMNINWIVRIKNKAFWLAIIPAVIVLVQMIADIFGVTLDLGEVGNKLIGVVNAVFTILAILGIVVDPTTKGMSDSTRALTYDKPNEE